MEASEKWPSANPHNEADEQRRDAGDHPLLRLHHDGVDREDHGEGEQQLHEQALERTHPWSQSMHRQILLAHRIR